ncbi:unnamed protein product, partial [Effrenium voratum]
PGWLEQMLQQHDERIVERLDAWLQRLELCLAGGRNGEVRRNGSVNEEEFWSTGETSSIGRMASTRNNAENDSMAQASPGSADLVGGPWQQRTWRSETVDSYDLAKALGEKVSQAFRLLGTHSRELNDRTSSILDCWRLCRRKAELIVNSQCAGAFFAMVILTNSVYLGVHLEWSAVHRSADHPANSIFKTLHVIYAVLFTLEALLQFVASGFSGYICGSSWMWNWLDIFIVTSSWVELAVDLANPEELTRGSNSNFRLMRLLRLGRLVRVVRIVRVVRLFRALRTLVYSLLGTLKSLFWSFLLLALIMYIFGILFTDLVIDFLFEEEQLGAAQHPLLEKYFGTLYLSMITLFRSISNGLTWHEAADALMPMGMVWVQVFHFYVAFCSFALLNVMTGVFCNSAIKAAERDHDAMLHSMVQGRREYQELVLSLFKRIDDRGLGQITINEFERHMDDDAVRSFFEYLQVGAMDAWTLFTSLDKDGDFTITVDEFLEQCTRLQGPARSADLYALRMSCAKLAKQVQRIAEIQQGTLPPSLFEKFAEKSLKDQRSSNFSV